MIRALCVTLAAAFPLVLLAGCGDDKSDYAGPAPASGPAVTVPAPAPFSANVMSDITPSWSTSGEADSVTLSLDHVGADAPVRLLTMTCVRGAVLRVESPQFTAAGDEDRLQIGAGDVVVGLPVVSAPDAAGVTGEGPAFRDLLLEVAVGRPISLSYGGQTLGPLPPTPDPMISRFTDRCREYLEPRAR